MQGDAIYNFSLRVLGPLVPILEGVYPYDPLISIAILGIIAYVLIKGARGYELLRLELEALVRRYLVFRGKRYGTRGIHTLSKGGGKRARGAITRSWNRFKEYHVQKRILLERNYRWMKRGVVFGTLLLALNTIREGVFGILMAGGWIGLLYGIYQYLPHYLLVVVGFALLRIQKEEVCRTPTHQIDPTLEAIFAEFERDDSRLCEEFDPLEEEKL